MPPLTVRSNSQRPTELISKCTHSGADLSKGKLEKNEVVCPWHKARFDVTNGKVTFQPKVLFRQLHLEDEPSYDVKLDGNSILVKV